MAATAAMAANVTAGVLGGSLPASSVAGIANSAAQLAAAGQELQDRLRWTSAPAPGEAEAPASSSAPKQESKSGDSVVEKNDNSNINSGRGAGGSGSAGVKRRHDETVQAESGRAGGSAPAPPGDPEASNGRPAQRRKI